MENLRINNQDGRISCNLDHVQYDHKPTADEVKALSVRLRNFDAIALVTVEGLLEAIEHGQTFTPAVMTGAKSDTWQSQQIIVADIDNDGEDILYPHEALNICNTHDINPYIYYSFSNTEDHPKYRIVVILSEPITAATEARDITERFTDIFNARCNNCADTKISDNARLIFGSREGSVIHTGTVTNIQTMRNLPARRSQATSHDESITELAELVANGIQRTQTPTQPHANNFDLLEALSYIPPEDYDEWIKCGMALKQEGYTVYDWDSWSQGSTKYKPGLCEDKWQSFSVKSGGRDTITGAYITSLAKNYGYIPPRERVKAATPTQPTTSNTITTATAEKVTPPEPEQVPPPTDQDAPPITAKTATPEPKKEEPEPTPDEVIDQFYKEIQSNRFEPITTGLEQLDKALQGGFERRTIVTLAAAPGTGKTAIAQYILENMAYNGHSVVYVNLEMDRTQLLSRSVSRISHKLKSIGVLPDDVTALQVKRGYQWTNDQAKIVNYSLKYYRDHIAPNFYYVTTNPENLGSIDNTLSDILHKLEKITAELQQQGKEPPLVCIDYLQFIEFDLYDEGQRKPDNADAIKQTLAAFKQFAMAHDTVVLMITANNRASNQDGRASMDSGRDTSNIEYSGDVMMSLVFTAIEEKWKYNTGKTDKDGNDRPAPIDNDFINDKIDYTLRMKGEYPLIAKLLSLKVVKGRSIMSRGVAKFIYDGAYYHFTEDTGTPNPYWLE